MLGVVVVVVGVGFGLVGVFRLGVVLELVWDCMLELEIVSV